MLDIEEVLHDPSAAFSDPAEVLCQQSLSRDDKVRVLEQWRYDVVQLQVAAEENLIDEGNRRGDGAGDGAARLEKIDDCLRQLSAGRD